MLTPRAARAWRSLLRSQVRCCVVRDVHWPEVCIRIQTLDTRLCLSDLTAFIKHELFSQTLPCMRVSLSSAACRAQTLFSCYSLVTSKKTRWSLKRNEVCECFTPDSAAGVVLHRLVIHESTCHIHRIKRMCDRARYEPIALRSLPVPLSLHLGPLAPSPSEGNYWSLKVLLLATEITSNI